jgi:dTDP-4-amino-4,6-dideoxygalactose transaminase
MNEMSFIPFHRPSIGEEEIAEAVDTLRSGWLTTGPKTAQFERDFEAYVKSPHALAANSCTAGLHLALAALGIGPGDEVITTPLTFCATVNTIMHVGATPVLADVGQDGNIDPVSVEARITPRTKAIIPVHLGGLPCDLGSLWRIARRYGLRIIEDAAHAVGTEYEGKPIGAASITPLSGSHAVAFSFYATKNLTTAEGGMVTTADPELHDRMKRLCLHGISRDAWNRYSDKGNWYYEVHECGFKYNLSDLQSSIGLHQLRKQERFIETRARYARLYASILADAEEVELPAEAALGSRNAWHLYSIRLNLGKLRIGRAEFIQALRERRIGASVHFIPIQLHPFFHALAKLPQNHCPTALGIYPRLVTLPLYPDMTETEVEYVGKTVRELLRENRTSATKVPFCWRHEPLPAYSDPRFDQFISARCAGDEKALLFDTHVSAAPTDGEVRP